MTTEEAPAWRKSLQMQMKAGHKTSSPLSEHVNKMILG